MILVYDLNREAVHSIGRVLKTITSRELHRLPYLTIDLSFGFLLNLFRG